MYQNGEKKYENFNNYEGNIRLHPKQFWWQEIRKISVIMKEILGSALNNFGNKKYENFSNYEGNIMFHPTQFSGCVEPLGYGLTYG